MKRRHFLKTAGKGLAGLAFAPVLPRCSAGRTKKGPNYIIVTLDTTRKDHLGCYGYHRNTSPNLDRFAAESLVLEDCYSTSHATLPSHASIFTSLYPYRHGVLGNDDALDPGIPALGAWLQENGYRTTGVTSTAFLNKYTVGNGFQEIFHSPSLERRAERTFDEALERVDQLVSEGKPFLLWVHLWDPHFRYNPPEHLRGKFAKKQETGRLLRLLRDQACEISDATAQLKELRLSEDEKQTIVDRYDEEIAYMDSQIGRFIEGLKQRQLYDRSVLAFLSDHGEAFFENTDNWTAHDDICETVVRIPLLIRHPDCAARRVGGLVQNIDLAPTLLKWGDLPIPAGIDGREMTGLIERGQRLRPYAYLTKGNSRTLSLVNEDIKFITSGKRREALPIPEQWERDLALPRIEFTSAIPPVWEYRPERGPAYCWRAPEGCEVDEYAMEVVTERVSRQDHVRTLEKIPEKTETGGRLVFGPPESPEVWNETSLVMPVRMRVIGKRNAETVASSDIKTVDMNSPLGHEPCLYDLRTDPNETQNIAQQHPRKVGELEHAIEPFVYETIETRMNGAKYLREHGAQAAKEQSMNQEQLEAIRALGYLD